MSEELQVDPLEVRMAADHVGAAADALRSAHGTAHDRIGAAQAGWIGSSAAALAATTAKWEEESLSHYTELIGHVDDLRSAAANYVGTDHQEASGIDSAASRLGSMGL
ncbi:WXG100 family type VII secretion target [Mycolicibacterium sp. ND9-15]|uniref:WXG100 family type VII secretion target n=1 Tax=Mycolicibacterium sp. ND9-15 TaxID=3042320 RepID=UPI002DDB581E|nr:WXG100 family type VII secretion target [Mycolicibacterium sp. ND9-15]WSE57711.1 WXG100 family type VII secretion target [Mycolicibacterium sp. ND9-15]